MKKYALLVGVENYRDQMISRLQFAHADATALADRLSHRCGFDQVRVLADENGDDAPDLLNIVTALNDIAGELRPDDLLLFFFAGHGLEKNGHGYLLARDSAHAFPEHVSLSLELLRKNLECLNAEKRILLLDACRNNPDASRSDSANCMGDVISRDIVAAARSKLTSGTTTVLLSACRSGQRAYEWPTKGHGVFTHYLIEGLDGAAWDNNELKFEQLAEFAATQVRQWTANTPGLSIPQEPWYEKFGDPTPILVAEGQPPIPPVLPSLPRKPMSVLPPKPTARWWILIDGKEYGPLDDAGVHCGINDGRILRDTKCWREGMDSWQSLCDVETWASAFPPLPPPPIPESANQSEKKKHRKESVDSVDAELHKSIEFDIQECIRGIMKGKGSKDYIEKVYKERLEDWKKAANLDWPEGQYLLGRCYDEGFGVPKQAFKAVQWYRKAAEQGLAIAQTNLGICYANGKGVSEDKSEAVKWYRKAAEQGYARAQLNLGICYANGEGVSEDKFKAVKWYRKAAEQGNVNAQINLGLCYANGKGVSEDKSEAAKWFRKAAEQGHAWAQFNLGICYANGKGVSEDKSEAVKWYRKAAEQGNASAQFNLGVCYANGEGARKDKSEAVKWYRKAVEQGYARAQFNLGLCYDNGKGVSEDKTEAVKWWRKAAEQGYAAAQYNLGLCYDKGEGVSKDESEAAKWYRKAAEQGNVSAQFLLGMNYAYGFGVSQDNTEAVKWLRKAAEQGNEDAKKELEELKKKKGGCFISTAVMDALGIADDGRPLMVLRRFRDCYMQRTPARQREVARYYQIAPQIVEVVNRCDQPKQVWNDLAHRFILPAVQLIDAGREAEAHALYRTMVETLAKQWLVTETDTDINNADDNLDDELTHEITLDLI